MHERDNLIGASVRSEVCQSPFICTEEMNSQVIFNMADRDCDFDLCLKKALDILAEYMTP